MMSGGLLTWVSKAQTPRHIAIQVQTMKDQSRNEIKKRPFDG